ncbi:MAG: GFA family protein [Halioglobus sp.]
MAQTYSGTCLCGEVTFHYQGSSLWCAHCHCSMCQRAHGAALVTWVGVPEGVFYLGSDKSLTWHASSEQAERGFCNNCGSTLFFRSDRWPGEMHIARANIDGDIDREPAAHVFWDAHVDWLKFEDGLPRVET